LRNKLGLLTTMLLVGCTGMLLGGGTSTSPGLGSESRTTAGIAEDQRIERSIVSAYKSDSLVSSASITVVSRLGIVTLKGTVASFDIRDRAVKIAGNMAGVQSVSSQIQVNTRQ